MTRCLDITLNGYMSVAHASIDVVVSNAFLEHVPDAEGAIEAIAKITKPGGFGVHIIDTIDHRTYGIPEIGPLDFLKIKSVEPLVHGCNRLRPKEYISIFEKKGFDVISTTYSNLVPLSEEDKNSLLPP